MLATSWSSGFWNTRPHFLRASTAPALSRVSCPKTRTLPSLGSSSASMWRASVDFPEPFSPTMQTKDPGLTERLTWEKASLPAS